MTAEPKWTLPPGYIATRDGRIFSEGSNWRGHGGTPMSKPAHTPGPWALEIRPGSGAAAYCTIATIEQADERAPYRGMIAYLQSAEHIDGIAADELRANAHLIKAAPDMADALAPISDMEMWTESADDNEAVILTVGTVRRMRAALAKARGEA